MAIPEINLIAGWVGMLGGVISGALIGLFFHKDGWMGGYGSFRRRMTRLGHISFFGLGFTNLLFAVSVSAMPVPTLNLQLSSLGFILGAVTMPLCCFLTAWQPKFRHLFPIPVVCVLVGIVSLLSGWA